MSDLANPNPSKSIYCVYMRYNKYNKKSFVILGDLSIAQLKNPALMKTNTNLEKRTSIKEKQCTF